MFGKKKEKNKSLEKVDPIEAKKIQEEKENIDLEKYETISSKKKNKNKNDFFYPYNVVIYNKKGSWEYEEDFGVELWREKNTKNKYLVRLSVENGTKKIKFFEPFPEDEFSPKDIMSKSKLYKDRIKELQETINSIEKEEAKTRKKLLINKKDYILEKAKLDRLVKSTNHSNTAQYIVKEKNNLYTIRYKEQDGFYIPQKYDFENNTILIPSESKRASRREQDLIDKNIFGQDNKVNWAMIFGWIILLLLIGANIWWSTQVINDANETPNAKIESLRAEVERGNIETMQQSKKYCEEYYEYFIEETKRLKNPDIYPNDPVEVNE